MAYPPESMWTTAAAPWGMDAGIQNWEHGSYFAPTVDGQITGIRFWRTSGSIAGTTGNLRGVRLWDVATHGLLYGNTVPSTVETGSGWKTFTLPIPFSVVTGKTYCVSYNTVDKNSYGPNPTVNNAPHLTALGVYYQGPYIFPDVATGQFLYADVVFQVVLKLTLTPATSPTQSTMVAITGADPGQVLTLLREHGGTRDTLGQVLCDSSGNGSYVDNLYPLDEPYRYLAYDSTGANLLATSAFAPVVSSGGQPWITDVYFTERSVPVWIVDVVNRLRVGRITPYTVVGQKYAITAGDVRSGSSGTLRLYAADHEYRDALIAVVSSGGPCSLRVPVECRSLVDEMYFAPVDMDEVRFGNNGASVLDLDFIETDATQLPPFQAVSYAVQTTNATAAGMDYSELSAAFLGKTYVDLYLSSTGIAP